MGRKSSDGENTIDLNLREKASHRDWWYVPRNTSESGDYSVAKKTYL